jgi:hypothetical protein
MPAHSHGYGNHDSATASRWPAVVYHRDDYPALLSVFSDPDNLPNTFDAWLQHAEGLERQLQAAGFVLARAWIRPAPFAAWCRERDISPDQQARLEFANETARHHHSRP